MKQYQPVKMDVILLEDEDLCTVSVLNLGTQYQEGNNEILHWDTPQFD